jgi:hypothetical protein
MTPQELYQAEMTRRRERYTASVAAVLAATSRAIEEQTEDPLDRFQSVPDRAAVPSVPTDAPAPVLLFVRGAVARPLTKKAQRAAASREATVRRAEAREAQRRAALTPEVRAAIAAACAERSSWAAVAAAVAVRGLTAQRLRTLAITGDLDCRPRCRHEAAAERRRAKPRRNPVPAAVRARIAEYAPLAWSWATLAAAVGVPVQRLYDWHRHGHVTDQPTGTRPPRQASVRDVRAAAEAELVLAHAATATDYADLARRSGVAVPTIWRLIREGALSLPARWRVPRRK